MKKWLIAVMAVFTPVACNDTEELNTDETADVIEQGTVGFEVSGGTVEEATGVPNDVKKDILAAFEEYMAAFKEKDIDRYAATLSPNASGFDYDDDIAEAATIFEQYEIQRTAEDVTIIKYSEQEVQVFAHVAIEMTQLETGAELSDKGRQVTVFVKEDESWKISSIYYIGNE